MSAEWDFKRDPAYEIRRVIDGLWQLTARSIATGYWQIDLGKYETKELAKEALERYLSPETELFTIDGKPWVRPSETPHEGKGADINADR